MMMTINASGDGAWLFNVVIALNPDIARRMSNCVCVAFFFTKSMPSM